MKFLRSQFGIGSLIFFTASAFGSRLWFIFILAIVLAIFSSFIYFNEARDLQGDSVGNIQEKFARTARIFSQCRHGKIRTSVFPMFPTTIPHCNRAICWHSWTPTGRLFKRGESNQAINLSAILFQLPASNKISMFMNKPSRSPIQMARALMPIIFSLYRR